MDSLQDSVRAVTQVINRIVDRALPDYKLVTELRSNGHWIRLYRAEGVYFVRHVAPNGITTVTEHPSAGHAAFRYKTIQKQNAL